MLNKSKSAKFFRLAFFSAFFAFLIVLLGAYGRLMDAGLGCPDWPGCYGKLFAPTTAQDIQEAREYFPKNTPESERAWQDLTHRYLAGALGLLMLRLTFLGWQLKKRNRQQQVILPGIVAALVFTHAYVGALTVSLRFKPLVMMGNLLGGVLIVALLWWIALREQRLWRSVTLTPSTRHLRVRALLGLILVAIVVVLGGWTNANHAALACPDFPTCQGAWWPTMDFIDSFTLWRDIGINYEGRILSLSASTAVHFAHRVGALFVLLYVGWLALHTMRVGYESNLCRYGLLVLVLLLCEVALGIINVVTHLPLVIGVLHNAFGVLLLLSLVSLNHAVRPRRPK